MKSPRRPAAEGRRLEHEGRAGRPGARPPATVGDSHCGHTWGMRKIFPPLGGCPMKPDIFFVRMDLEWCQLLPKVVRVENGARKMDFWDSGSQSAPNGHTLGTSYLMVPAEI